MPSCKSKPCDLCNALAAIRYRIQVDESGRWFLACPTCQREYSQDNSNYRYGGTWKARQ